MSFLSIEQTLLPSEWRMFVVRSLLSAFLLLAPNSPSVDRLAADVIEDAKTNLTSYYESIASLEVQFQVIQPGTAGGQKITPDGNPCEPQQYRWIKQGESEMLAMEAWRDPVQKEDIFNKRWVGFDGRRFCNVLFDSRKSDEVSAVLAHSSLQHRDFVDDCRAGIVSGLHLWQSHLSLLSLINRKQMAHLGSESVGGQVCEVFDFGEYEGFTEWIYRAKCWLDPQHGFLPRRLELSVIRNTKTGEPSPPLAWRGEVVEFFQADDFATSRKRWFPKKATVLGSELVVEDAKFNLPVEIKRFTPELPAGVIVTYPDEKVRLGDSDQTVVRSEITGGEVGQREFLTRVKQHESENREKRLLLIAESQSFWRRHWLWWSTGIVAVSALTVFLFRYSRR